MSEKIVNIAFSKDEALVLFEFLSRFSDTEKLEIEHQSEIQALWNLACLFEKELTEPFQENYRESLTKAREALEDKMGRKQYNKSFEYARKKRGRDAQKSRAPQFNR